MSGLVIVGIGTIIFLVLNGIIVSISIRDQLNGGMNFYEVLVKIVPHGVFEVPALLCASIIGFKSITIIVRILFSSHPNKKILIDETFKIILLIFIIILLLFLGAVVEWYIT